VTWTVNVEYPIGGWFGVDDRSEDAIEQIAERLHAPVTGSGSGMGMRDLDLLARNQAHAGELETAVLAAVPGAIVTKWDDGEQPLTAERRDLTAAEAEAMLPAGPVVHTFVQLPAGLGGADRPRQEVLAMLRDATAIFRAGPDRAPGHGLAVLQVRDGHAEVTFLETGQRRDQLHLAIGVFAGYLAGQATEAEMLLAAAALEDPDQLADYTAITEDLRAAAARARPEMTDGSNGGPDD
jgi:hypothetical protein